MLKNLELSRFIYSQRIMLELTKKGMSREKAYSLVQNKTMKTWKGTMFYKVLCDDKLITNKISVNKLRKLFDYDYNIKINIIFKRGLKI